MRRLAATAMLLAAARVQAGTAYVTDELVLNVYAERNQQGERLATLHSGASVEALAIEGDYTQIRWAGNSTGWVKSAYLTTNVPATVRVKALEVQLDESRATTPGLAEAAARSELERLRQELASKQSEVDAARSVRDEPQGAHGSSSFMAPRSIGLLPAACAMVAVGVLGFWLGYVVLARRVRRKFGGLKVY